MGQNGTNTTCFHLNVATDANFWDKAILRSSWMGQHHHWTILRSTKGDSGSQAGGVKISLHTRAYIYIYILYIYIYPIYIYIYWHALGFDPNVNHDVNVVSPLSWKTRQPHMCGDRRSGWSTSFCVHGYSNDADPWDPALVTPPIMYGW